MATVMLMIKPSGDLADNMPGFTPEQYKVYCNCIGPVIEVMEELGLTLIGKNVNGVRSVGLPELATLMQAHVDSPGVNANHVPLLKRAIMAANTKHACTAFMTTPNNKTTAENEAVIAGMIDEMRKINA